MSNGLHALSERKCLPSRTMSALGIARLHDTDIPAVRRWVRFGCPANKTLGGQFRCDPHEVSLWLGHNEHRWLTRGRVAAMLGVTPKIVKRWIREGLPTAPFTSCGRIDLTVARQWQIDDQVKERPKPIRIFPDNRPGVIYAICDPITDRVRYVGKAHDFKERKRNHLSDLRRNKHRNAHLQRWANKMAELPTFRILQECLPGTMNACEQEWIARGRAKGWKLCNMTEGGDSGGGMADETKARISASSKAKWATPEYKARHEAFRANRKGMTIEQYREWAANGKRSENRMRYGPSRAAWERTRADEWKHLSVVPLTHAGTAFVPLTNGKWAMIDEDDADRVSKRRWYANLKAGRENYWRARCSSSGDCMLLSRFILQLDSHLQARHRNHNSLDCRKSNLVVRTIGLPREERRRILRAERQSPIDSTPQIDRVLNGMRRALSQRPHDEHLIASIQGIERRISA